jgi:DNA-binding transcriptional LysR family regulator
VDRFAAMASFVRIVESGSLSAAARAQGQSLAAVSRQLAQFEDALGVRLLNRTTRKVAATEPGRAFYAQAKRILGDLEEAEATLARGQAEPSGPLVVAMAAPLGVHVIGPALPGFLERYPKLTLDLRMSARYVSLVDEGIDVALRIGPLADSTLMARKLGEFRRVICASPAYLEAHGRPRSPADLARHRCLVVSDFVDRDEWRLRGPLSSSKPGETKVRVAGPLRANSIEMVIAACIGGAGLAFLDSWQVADALRARSLVVVLPDYASPPVPVHALYPAGRHLSAKVRAFVDFAAAVVRAAAPFAAVTARRKR